MKISYDPSKRKQTLDTRQLDFEDAVLVFSGKNLEFDDDREDYGERRINCYGWFYGRMVVVGYTPRGEVRHIFSMRKANDREKKRIGPLIGS